MKKFIILLSLFISCINAFSVDVGDGHEYVDLGLTSGTLWATCNIGADSPYETGSLYAWGETYSKQSFSWGNYSLCNGTSKYFTKYCTSRGIIDDKTVLDDSDDAATVNWGKEWVMPTLSQIKELLDECSVSISVSSLGDVYWILTGPNGNKIIFPRSDATIQASEIWSKEMMTDEQSVAFTMFLSSSGKKTFVENRCNGIPIRPVIYAFNPSNPPNPQAVPEKKALYLTSYPEGCCSFNIVSGTMCQSGSDLYLEVYANQGYEFKGWYENEQLVSSSFWFYYTMPKSDVTLQARFEYNPTNPANPNSNGQADVDNAPTLVTSIVLDKFELEMKALETTSLSAIVSPSDATYPQIEWESSNEDIVRVDENGVLTAIVGGEATITAKATDGSGVVASCKVTVENPIFNLTYVVDGVEVEKVQVPYSTRMHISHRLRATWWKKFKFLIPHQLLLYKIQLKKDTPSLDGVRFLLRCQQKMLL